MEAKNEGFSGPVRWEMPNKFTIYIAEDATIESGAYVRNNVKIYPGASIGKGAMIGDGCIIRENVPVPERQGVYPTPECPFHNKELSSVKEYLAI